MGDGRICTRAHGPNAGPADLIREVPAIADIRADRTEIVDAHHHIWRVDRTPWLTGPSVPRIFGHYEPLRRDYLIEDYALDVKPNGVVASIGVQANVAPGGEVEELEWATSSGIREGLVQGFVAFADLASADVGAVLDRELAFSGIRGIRQQLHWHDNPAYRVAATPAEMLRSDWQHGLKEVTARGLVFELQVFPSQYDSALQLIDAFPNTTFVLIHAGMVEDRSAEGWAAWRQGLASVAARRNVYVKLSGLGTFIRRCELADWRPVVEQTVDTFGPDRCMFGSNFPIEGMWTSYANLVDVFVRCIASYSEAERRQILHDVAVHVYRAQFARREGAQESADEGVQLESNGES